MIPIPYLILLICWQILSACHNKYTSPQFRFIMIYFPTAQGFRSRNACRNVGHWRPRRQPQTAETQSLGTKGKSVCGSVSLCQCVTISCLVCRMSKICKCHCVSMLRFQWVAEWQRCGRDRAMIVGNYGTQSDSLISWDHPIRRSQDAAAADQNIVKNCTVKGRRSQFEAIFGAA